jgi:hypothetical protein
MPPKKNHIISIIELFGFDFSIGTDTGWMIEDTGVFSFILISMISF